MHRRWLLGLAPLTLGAALFAACDTDAARVGLVMKAPAGLLDEATGVDLAVFPADQAQCLGNGQVTQIPSGESTQTFSLDRGCAGAAWCKEIELDLDDSDKMFAVTVKGPLGPAAYGCAVATIDQDPLEVDIRVFKYNPPRCCNDGVVQSGEQCDSGTVAATDCSGVPDTGGVCLGIPSDPVCECDCLAKEIPLERKASDGFTTAGTRSQLALAFAGGVGELTNGLRAAFTNVETSLGKNVQIRDLRADFFPVEDPAPLAGPLNLPLRCSDTDTAGTNRDQQGPSIAAITNERTAVAYLSDQDLGGFFDVYLSSQNASGCSDVTSPAKVNLTNKRCSGVDVARGAGGQALIVWTTVDGAVLGRIWKPAAVPPLPETITLFPAAADLVLAQNATLARVAGSDDGWLVVYSGGGPDDGDGVFSVRVDEEGQAAQPLRVNAVTTGVQGLPDVAMFADGRALVTWHSGGDVYFQRFAADDSTNPEDQASPIHLLADGEQSAPAAAASEGFGEFFAVAWENQVDGSVWARFLGIESGFLFNSVTGQNDDFLASHPLPGVATVRRAPAVAIGGGGFVAFGWQDDSAVRPGLYVRRFPLPTQ
jgi:hypothetical protein